MPCTRRARGCGGCAASSAVHRPAFDREAEPADARAAHARSAPRLGNGARSRGARATTWTIAPRGGHAHRTWSTRCEALAARTPAIAMRRALADAPPPPARSRRTGDCSPTSSAFAADPAAQRRRGARSLRGAWRRKGTATKAAQRRARSGAAATSAATSRTSYAEGGAAARGTRRRRWPTTLGAGRRCASAVAAEAATGCARRPPRPGACSAQPPARAGAATG